MSLAAGTRLGAYEVLSSLGAGGMGEVYSARDPRLSREVALKILPSEVASDASRLKRFEKEARAASALNHPNIVTIYDVGSTDSVSWIAMERVEGKTLREILFGGALPLKRLLQIATQVAAGLARAHEAGIVHRDLKPENVMVAKEGLVKILDFGLAKRTGPVSGSDEGSHLPTETGTSPGVVLGTVGYMSPEQAEGRQVDFRSDQFSFGSILYEMATGTRAFQKGSAVDTLSAILHEEPKALAQVVPAAPPPLRWIVERCLAKDPEERYGSTRDLARDLAAVRDHISEVTSGVETPVSIPAKRKRILLPLLAAAGAFALGAAAWAVARGVLSREPSAPTLRRLTFRSGAIHNARFAADGQTVVYGATWQGDQSRLYQTRPESPESRPFDFGADDADILAISPSAEMAILLPFSGVVGNLARVPMGGGTPRQVLVNVHYAGADWAPDGRNLVVAHVSDSSGYARILEYPIGHALYSDNNPMSPRFSPNGDWIAFFDGDELSIIDPSGKNRRVLAGGAWASLTGVPGWRPDGKEIWFSGSRGNGQPEAIHGVTLAGKVRLLFRAPGALELDDVSRDGRALAAHHTFINTVRGRISADEKERELSWLDGSDLADLSDDGKTLVMTETGEGTGASPTVYLRSTDGSPAIKLGEGTAIALSPDGKWVLTSHGGEGTGKSKILLLPTSAGQVKSLPGERFPVYYGGGWLPDGKRFVFSAGAVGRSRIYLQSSEEGGPRPISPDGFWIQYGRHPISTDGKWVVCLKGIIGSVRSWWLLPTDGGEPRPVAGLKPGESAIRWSEDSRFLFVSPDEPHDPLPIWILDPTNGQRRLSSEIRVPEPISGLLLASDPKSYVYSSTRIYSALYLIEGLR